MQFDHVYNLESIKAFIDSHKKPGFTDAAIGVVLARHLTQVDPKIFEKKYPELCFVNCGLTVDNSGGYNQRIQSLRVIEQGKFSHAGDTSGNKGKISLTAEDSSILVLEKETEMGWTDTEVKQAELQNINLISRYMQATQSIYLREIDLAIAIGVPDISASKGLLNHASLTAEAFGHNVTTASSATDDFNEFSELITDQRNAVNNTPEYSCNCVCMPVSVMNVISAKLLNTANASNVTVLQALKNAFPDIQWQASFRAESVSGTKRAVAFSNRDEVMKVRIPLPLQIGEIVKEGSFKYKTDAKYRIAGLDLLETTGGRIATGL